tara:strand:+ start:241 stop:1233 length:993 start_codon:yes stop_codon:yes gene_type:complete
VNSDQKQHSEPCTNNSAGRLFKLGGCAVFVIVLFGFLFLWYLLSLNQAAITALEAKVESKILKAKAEQEALHRRFGSIEESILLKTNELVGRIEANQKSFSEKIGSINWFSFDQIGAVRHARYLLNRAQQALLWSRNTSYAISLLEQTRSFLLSAEDEKFEQAAELISQQIKGLKLVNSDSSGQIHLKLDVISDLIDSLDLVKTEFAMAKSPPTPDDFWDEAWDSLNKYINVRFLPDSIDGVELSNLNDGDLVKLRWRLCLQEIRYSVLSQDQELYQDSLNELSSELIKINFQFEDLAKFQVIVAELSSYDVGPIPSNIELILNLSELEN